jgi:hypothetical protein
MSTTTAPSMPFGLDAAAKYLDPVALILLIASGLIVGLSILFGLKANPLAKIPNETMVKALAALMGGAAVYMSVRYLMIRKQGAPLDL